jgi:hypothetical protein
MFPLCWWCIPCPVWFCTDESLPVVHSLLLLSVTVTDPKHSHVIAFVTKWRHVLRWPTAAVLEHQVASCLVHCSFGCETRRLCGLCDWLPTEVVFGSAPHNDVSVNDRPRIRRWSHNIIQGEHKVFSLITNRRWPPDSNLSWGLSFT